MQTVYLMKVLFLEYIVREQTTQLKIFSKKLEQVLHHRHINSKYAHEEMPNIIHWSVKTHTKIPTTVEWLK